MSACRRILPNGNGFSSHSSDGLSINLDTTVKSDSIVEYAYSTYPEWVGDAVSCTSTGIELNFEKLNQIAGSEMLPKEMSITLHSTASSLTSSIPSPASSMTENLYSSSELGGDDSIVSAHYTPVSSRTISKLNGTRTGFWNKESNSSGQQNSYPLDKLTRRESVVELEIRQQQEREKDLCLQRQFINKLNISSSTPTLSINGGLSSPTQTPTTNGSHYPSKYGKTRNPALSSSLSQKESQNGSQKESQNWKTTADPTDNNIRSPVPEAPQCSPWYVSESPIERDIRVTKEREEALQSSRQQKI